MTEAETHEARHVDDDLAALALGALDSDERAAVEAHLATCERCRALLGGYGDVAASLRATGVAPSASERVWQDIATQLHSPRRRSISFPGPSRLAWWGAVAATALALAAGAGWYVGQQASDDGGTPADLVGLPTDDLVFSLLNLEQGSPAGGRIFMNTDRTRGVVVITNLHRLDSERQWGIWVVLDDRTRKLMGTFGVDADGAAIVPLVFASLPADYDAASIGLAISPVLRKVPGEQAGPDVLFGPLY